MQHWAIKVNHELDFSGLFNFGFDELDFILGWNSNIYSGSNLRFTSNFNFNNWHLFLSNCWLLISVFLPVSAVKTRVWTFFSAQQSRIMVLKFYFAWVSKLGFSIPSQLLTQTEFENPQKYPFQTRKGLFLVYFKVHIFWEGHKIGWNLHHTFDYSKYSQK